ncbi:helix-turn-helix transcriptional regulator [Pseudonocardiaceae bacterium YIM PH 21723]|nr:helix-turn-helix transcriptional regulator [Pseudonocardiaceae bacterium YIM PH 21723]
MRGISSRPRGRLAGRTAELAALHTALALPGRTQLTGPPGIGKSLLAASVVQDWQDRRDPVLRITPRLADRKVPDAGLAQLLSLIPEKLAETLPQPQRDLVERLLRREPTPPAGWDELTLRMAVSGLLEEHADRRPLLLVVDDAAQLDEASAAVLHAVSAGIHLLLVRREATGTQLRLGPLSSEDTAELLAAQGLEHRWVSRVFAASGGNPALAIDLGLTAARNQGNPADAASGSVPISLPVRARICTWLDELPPPAQRTVLCAALAGDAATTGLLRRAGQPEADEHLWAAAGLGLVAVDRDQVGFPATAVRDTLIQVTPPGERAKLHAILAEASGDEVEAARHLGLSTADPDAGMAHRLERAAEICRRRGRRDQAADLLVLAADRTPAAEPDIQLDRLQGALAEARQSLNVPAARTAAQAVLRRATDPADRARARLTMWEFSGQALLDNAELLEQAAAEATGHPDLLSEVHLQLAITSCICRGDLPTAARHATRSARYGARANSRLLESRALTQLSRYQRILGESCYMDTLNRAISLDRNLDHDVIGESPYLVASRFAVWDDRLTEGREITLTLIAELERRGLTAAVVVPLRSLQEIYAQTGQCAEALAIGGRVVRLINEQAGSIGPAWYSAALGEYTGGSFAAAAEHAAAGMRAAGQDHDLIHTSRNLYVLGCTELAMGDYAGAVAHLRRCAELEAEQGVVDPSILRWHGELATALALSGAPEEASRVIAQWRPVATRLRRESTLLALNRAEGVVRAVSGDIDAATTLLSGAADRFGGLGLTMQRARTLLLLGQAQLKARRRAGARDSLRRARTEFQQRGAVPWTALADQELRKADESQPGLSGPERRLVELVVGGMTNVEAAGTLHLSVKTIEAMLTRIYRKHGLRSRSQLGSVLRG